MIWKSRVVKGGRNGLEGIVVVMKQGPTWLLGFPCPQRCVVVGGARSSCLLAEPAEPPKRSDDLLKKKNLFLFASRAHWSLPCTFSALHPASDHCRLHPQVHHPTWLGAGLAYYVFFLLLFFSPPRSHVARFQVRRWLLARQVGTDQAKRWAATHVLVLNHGTWPPILEPRLYAVFPCSSRQL